MPMNTHSDLATEIRASQPEDTVAAAAPQASNAQAVATEANADAAAPVPRPSATARKAATSRKRASAMKQGKGEAADAKPQIVAPAATAPKTRPRNSAAVPAPVGEPAPAPDKQVKLKLVRDSFTIPRLEYEAIDLLKSRALKLERAVKKSELLRAGLMLLTSLDDGALKRALDAVPSIKSGRPKKVKEKAEAPSVSPGSKPKNRKP